MGLPAAVPAEGSRSCRVGGRVADVARDLDISDQSIYSWRRQDRVDKGLIPGLTSAERSELTAAKKRIHELETELAIARRAVELLKDAGDRNDPKGGPRRSR